MTSHRLGPCLEDRAQQAKGSTYAGQVVERELGPAISNLLTGAWQAVARIVAAGKQASVLDQVQANERLRACLLLHEDSAEIVSLRS